MINSGEYGMGIYVMDWSNIFQIAVHRAILNTPVAPINEPFLISNGT
jgi:hypothetical protein